MAQPLAAGLNGWEEPNGWPFDIPARSIRSPLRSRSHVLLANWYPHAAERRRRPASERVDGVVLAMAPDQGLVAVRTKEDPHAAGRDIGAIVGYGSPRKEGEDAAPHEFGKKLDFDAAGRSRPGHSTVKRHREVFDGVEHEPCIDESARGVLRGMRL